MPDPAIDREGASHRPDSTPQGLREMLDRAVALSTDYWERFPAGRVYTRPPEAMRAAVRAEPLPRDPVPADETFAAIADTFLRNPLGMGHPRWWGFIAASAHPMGVAADLLAGAVNNACFAGAQLATDYERLVVRWLGQLCGFPDPGGGILVSGGSMANVVALAAARDALVRRGLDWHAIPAAAYYSSNAHYAVPKALRVLGCPARVLREIPTAPDGRFDVQALRAQMERDRADGVRPALLAVTAGTAGTGVIDPLGALAEIAEETGCWLHVDGAYGGPVASLPELAPQFAGIDRADSVVVDPHKWLYVPYEAGAVLVRRQEDLLAAFASVAAYTDVAPDTYFDDDIRYQDLGPQQTRGFRALKVWATIRSIGLEGYRELWRKDLAVRAAVCRLARRHPRLEVLSEGPLSIFVLRYVPAAGDPDQFNRRLLDAVHRDGRMFLGPMTLDGRAALRGCVVNFRSTLDDARICVETLVELGARLEADAAGS